MARQLFFSGKIEDDRGMKFAMREQGINAPRTPAFWIAKKLGGSTERREDVISSALAQRTVLRHEMTKTGRLALYLRRGFFVACVGIILFVALGKGATVAIPFIVLFGLYLVAAAEGRRQFGRKRAQLRTLPNVCVVCIYDLSGITPEEDNCTICPECGAAWKLGDPD